VREGAIRTSRTTPSSEYLSVIMSTRTTEEPLYEMQEEGGVPTMDAEGELSPPSMDENLQPCIVVLDMKEMDVMQSIGTSRSTMSHSESSPEFPQEASPTISKEVGTGGLSFFAAYAFAQGGTLLTSSSLAHMKKKREEPPATTYYSSQFWSRCWFYSLVLVAAAVIVGVACELIL
jgi:hypothetical protein